MANETQRARVNELLESVHGYAIAVSRAQQQRAQLMATAQTAGGRVSVTVNADGVVIDVRFAEDIEELTYAEIAAAVRIAAQEAATVAKRESAEIMRSVQMPATLPKFSEIRPELPDLETLRAMMPKAPEVSTAPPDSPSRTTADDRRRPGRGSEVKDTGW